MGGGSKVHPEVKDGVGEFYPLQEGDVVVDMSLDTVKAIFGEAETLCFCWV